MATKAVLIIGGSGFIGTRLALRLRERFKVFATYHRHRITIPGVTTLPAAIQHRDWIRRIVYLAQPAAIIYAAGNNSVEWADANAQDTEALHATGPATVSNAADILQPKFISLSNCYVFDGIRGNYRESDMVLPSVALGKAKLGGENFIRSRSLGHVIIRSSTLLGRGNGLNLTLLDRLRMKLESGERVELANDQLHNFALVDGLVDLIERVIDSSIRKRTLHYGGLTKLTPFQMGRAFAEHFGYDPKLIVPTVKRSKTKSEELEDYSLNCTQAVELLKIKPLLLEESFDLIDQKLIPRS